MDSTYVINILIVQKTLGTNLLKILSLCSKQLNNACKHPLQRHKYLYSKYRTKLTLAVWKKLIGCELKYKPQTHYKYVGFDQIGTVNDLLCLLAGPRIREYFSNKFAVLTGMHLIVRDKIPFYYGIVCSNKMIYHNEIRESDYERISNVTDTVGDYVIESTRYIYHMPIPLAINPIPLAVNFLNQIRLCASADIEYNENNDKIMTPDIDFCLEFISGVFISYRELERQDCDFKLDLHGDGTIFTRSMLRLVNSSN